MRRWTLVAVAAAVLVALPLVLAGIPASSTTIGPTQLRARILASADQPYSGFVQTDGQLGLPSLPQLSDVTSLLSGSTQARVWYRAPEHNRVDVITGLGERDVYQTPEGDYTWDYGSNLLTEIVGQQDIRLPREGDLIPPDLARRVLTLDQQDPVTGLPSRRIAGIDAAGLRLRPTDPATTVGQVDIWADPATGLPLRVEVTAHGGTKPVLASQFIDLSRGDPGDAVLAPPVNTSGGFTRTDAPDVMSVIGNLGRGILPPKLAGYDRQPGLVGLPGVGRYGTGLSTFVVLPLPRDVGRSAIDSATKAGAAKVTVPNGRAVLIQIPLLTVLIEQAGFGRRTYLVAGLVDHAVVQQAAAELAVRRRTLR